MTITQPMLLGLNESTKLLHNYDDCIRMLQRSKTEKKYNPHISVSRAIKNKIKND